MKRSRSVSQVFFVLLIFIIKSLEGLTTIKCVFVVMAKVFEDNSMCLDYKSFKFNLETKVYLEKKTLLRFL